MSGIGLGGKASHKEAEFLRKRPGHSKRGRGSHRKGRASHREAGPITETQASHKEAMQGISKTEVKKSNRLGLFRAARWCYI